MASAADYAGTLIGLAMIAGAHLLVPRLSPSGRWQGYLLDGLAGIAIAYAFVDVFPHLAEWQAQLQVPLNDGVFGYLAHHLYVMALLGFVAYLGVRLGMPDRTPSAGASRLDIPTPQKLLFLSVCAYNFVIGYMLAEQPTHRVEPSLLFALAMAAHFLGLDQEHRRSNPAAYDRLFRYVYVACLSAGWVAGLLTEFSNALFALVYAYLAGGIVSAGVTAKLPRVRARDNFVAFVLGALAFTLLILGVEAFRS